MGKRQPNHRLAKLHRNYTVDEVAELFSIHKNTVRNWVAQGLPVNDDRRPLLILGRELHTFLQRKRTANKQPCKPGEIYCVKCRAPQAPAGNMADYVALSLGHGNLVGICPSCQSMMYRRVRFCNLALISGNLEVCLPKALQHIDESDQPSVNCELKQGA
jgi:hypothetical protein